MLESGEALICDEQLHGTHSPPPFAYLRCLPLTSYYRLVSILCNDLHASSLQTLLKVEDWALKGQSLWGA